MIFSIMLFDKTYVTNELFCNLHSECVVLVVYFAPIVGPLKWVPALSCLAWSIRKNGLTAFFLIVIV